MVYKEVVDELENARVVGHEERCVQHVTDCVYHIADTCNDVFSNDLCNRLLLKTRDKSSKVCTLRTDFVSKLEHVFRSASLRFWCSSA